MKALRSRNFAKLSSSNSTRDVYWVASISAGTPAGYCLSQMRSMVFPLPVGSPVSGRGALFGAILSNAAAHGKRRRAIGISLTETGRSGRLKSSSGVRRGGGLLIYRIGFAGRALRRRLGLGGSLRLWRLCGGIRVFCGGRFGRRIRLFRRHPRLLAAMRRRLLFGFRGHGRNQGGPGLGRTYIDRDRLRGRGLRRQQVRRLCHRRLQPGGEEGDGGFAGAWTAVGIGGDGVFILVAGGAFVFSPAHLVAQVRR